MQSNHVAAASRDRPRFCCPCDLAVVNRLLALGRKALLTTKPGQWLLVMLAVFITPDDLRNSSLIRRLANYTTPVLASAGFFAFAFSIFGGEILGLVPIPEGVDPKYYHTLLSRISGANKLFGFALCAVATYAVALWRYGYHRIWVGLLLRLGQAARPVSVKFFILKASSGAFLVGVFCLCMSVAVPALAEGRAHLAAEFIERHPALMLAAMIAMGCVGELKNRINQLSDRQMYGASWGPFAKGAVTLILLLGLVYALPLILAAARH